MTLSLRTDRRLIRATAHSTRFLLVELTAPAARPRDGRERPSVNLAFVLDRSGSMGGEKIRLARQAVEEGIERLKPADRFSVVIYDDVIDVVVESTHATPEARRNAIERVRRIDARGSTNLGDGYLRGCEQIAAHLATEGVNRALLLTDGLANVGITDPEELARHAAELRRRGISTTTFGVGTDFDEELLRAMSVAGGGNFYFIETAAQIVDFITSEVGETLEVTAREVSLEVSAPEGLFVEALSPYPSSSAGARTSIRIGDLVSEQQLAVVLRLTFPYGEPGHEIGAQVAAVTGDGEPLDGGPARVAWQWADHAANDRQDRDRVVDRAVAVLFAARARQGAVKFNRAGDFEGARHYLLATARRIREYAGRDRELRRIVDELEREADTWSMPQMELSRKVAHAQSSYTLRCRSDLGRAIKKQQ